jgi:hypothetical protein
MMAAPEPKYEMAVQARGTAYTYMITRSDDKNWAEWSGDYSTFEAAAKAGQAAVDLLNSQPGS